MHQHHYQYYHYHHQINTPIKRYGDIVKDIDLLTSHCRGATGPSRAVLSTMNTNSLLGLGHALRLRRSTENKPLSHMPPLSLFHGIAGVCIHPSSPILLSLPANTCSLRLPCCLDTHMLGSAGPSQTKSATK